MALAVTAAGAQQQSSEARLRAERAQLEQLRRERAELQRRMSELQSNVHDLSEEVGNLDRQADMTALRAAGYAEPFLSVEEGVGRYVASRIEAPRQERAA